MKKIPHKRATARALRVDESLSFDDQVAHRAYELWHQRGREHGADMADWFQAQREVHEWHRQRLGTTG